MAEISSKYAGKLVLRHFECKKEGSQNLLPSNYIHKMKILL